MVAAKKPIKAKEDLYMTKGHPKDVPGIRKILQYTQNAF